MAKRRCSVVKQVLRQRATSLRCATVAALVRPEENVLPIATPLECLAHPFKAGDLVDVGSSYCLHGHIFDLQVAETKAN